MHSSEDERFLDSVSAKDLRDFRDWVRAYRTVY